jgi:uncharacterized protein (TIGR03435 family)
MVVATALVAVAAPVLAGVMHGSVEGALQANQTPSASAGPRPEFAAASIKRNRSSDPLGQVILNAPGRVTATNTLLRLMIAAAYQPGFPPRRSQMSLFGLPDWDESEHFDLDARADGNPNVNEKRGMLQSMLADRFKLAIHPEKRQGPVFGMTMANAGRLGSGLKPHSASSPCVDPAAPLPPQPPPGTQPAPPAPAPPCGGIRVSVAYVGRTMITRLGANAITMQALAERLSWFQDADRTVIDNTGLTGTFDLYVEWTPTFQPPPPPGSPAAEAPASDAGVPAGQFTALAEQLGLRFAPQMGPIDVLVIDRVERPTEN